jgi:hypothetical protein
MLTPEQILAVQFLVANYLNATTTAVGEATWYQICRMCAAGGVEAVATAAGVSITKGALTASLTTAELQMLRNIALKQAAKQAAKTGMTISMDAFIVRLGANFGRCPKGPGPLMVATVLLTLAMSAHDVHAATLDAENYQKYILRYSEFLTERIAQGDLGRGSHIPRPLKFEEWQRDKVYLP